MVALLTAAAALVPLRLVRVKMLPFDNKSEMQVVLNMPDGTPLEQTAHVAQALGNELAKQPDVVNYQIYAGTSGPYNFNGLVRHYYLRSKPNQADIQVNLTQPKQRGDQSHAHNPSAAVLAPIPGIVRRWPLGPDPWPCPLDLVLTPWARSALRSSRVAVRRRIRP